MSKIMSEIMFTVLFVFFCAAIAAAQDDYNKFEVSGNFVESFNKRYVGDTFFYNVPANPFFAGFSQNFDTLDKGERYKLKGFEASGVYNFSKYLGAKIDFSYHSGFSNNGFGIPSGFFKRANGTLLAKAGNPALSQNIKQHNYLGGIQVKNNSKRKRFKPFGHFMAGLQQLDSYLSIPQSFTDDFGLSKSKITNFTLDVGGGLDIRIHRRIDIRAIQIDYNPVFAKEVKILSVGQTFSYNGEQVTSLQDLRIPKFTQNNIRIGFGVVFH